MSRRGGKRRTVLQLDNSSSTLHKYGYDKDLQPNEDSQDQSLKLLEVYSDSDTDPEPAGNLFSSNDGAEKEDMSSDKPTPIKNAGVIDSQLKHFFSEIDGIPTAAGDNTNHTSTTVINMEDDLPATTQPEAVKTKSTYSMFVKGESEFTNKQLEENSTEKTKKKVSSADFPKEPTTSWQLVQDDNTQYYYYWNIETNEVTWEIPSDYTQYLLLHKEYLDKMSKYTDEEIQANSLKTSTNEEYSETKNNSSPSTKQNDTHKHDKKKRSHKSKKSKRKREEETEHELNGKEVNKNPHEALSIVPYLSDADDTDEGGQQVSLSCEQNISDSAPTIEENKSSTSHSNNKSDEISISKKDDKDSKSTTICQDAETQKSEATNSQSKDLDVKLNKPKTDSTIQEKCAVDSNDEMGLEQKVKDFMKEVMESEPVLPERKEKKEPMDMFSDSFSEMEKSSIEHSSSKPESIIGTSKELEVEEIETKNVTELNKDAPTLAESIFKTETKLNLDIEKADSNSKLVALSSGLSLVAYESEEEEGELKEGHKSHKNNKNDERSSIEKHTNDERSSVEKHKNCDQSISEKHKKDERSSIEKHKNCDQSISEKHKKYERSSIEKHKKDERSSIKKHKNCDQSISEKHKKDERRSSEKNKNDERSSIEKHKKDERSSNEKHKKRKKESTVVKDAEPEKIVYVDEDVTLVDDKDMELDFEDLDDIDRVLEMALEKKLGENKEKAILKTSSTEPDKNQLTIQEENKTSLSPSTPTLVEELNEKHEDISKEEMQESADLILNKLDFLDISADNLSRLQVLFIELQTRLSDWKAGGLSTNYFVENLKVAEGLLEQYELSAVPSGWACEWDRDNGRYFYRNLTTNKIQWGYPDVEVKHAKTTHEHAETKIEKRSRSKMEDKKSRSRHKKRDERDKSKDKREKRGSSHRHSRKKRRRHRGHSTSSESEERSSHQRSKKKRRHRSEKSPSVELLDNYIDSDEVMVITSPPSIKPSSEEANVMEVEKDNLELTPVESSELLQQSPEHEPLIETEAPFEAGSEEDTFMKSETLALPEEEIINPAVISKPPQITIPPQCTASVQVENANSNVIVSAPPLTLPTVEKPPPEDKTDVPVVSSDADKSVKKKKKDKSSMMKKKGMSSMVQKWQQVKKQVEKEDRAKELRQAAIRQKIADLK